MPCDYNHSLIAVNTEIQLFVSRGIVDGLLLAVWVYVPEIYPTRVRNVAVGSINTAGKLGAVFGILSVQVMGRNRETLKKICLVANFNNVSS